MLVLQGAGAAVNETFAVEVVGGAEVGVRFDFWTGRYTLVRLQRGVVAKISLEKAVEEYIPSKIGCNKFPLSRRGGGLYQTWLDCNVDETENSDVWKEALADHCYWPIMNDLKVKSATPCTMVGQGAKAFRCG